ncbi:MAG TPA: serine/threonine-protein kinase, partial [Pirellulales bacterium]
MDLGRFGQLAPRGVGRDGMAFAAVDPEQTGKRVELRVLVTAPGSRTARRRAEQRLRAAAMLRHPAAASVTELLLEHDPPFAVLPFVDGERLDLRLAHRPADLFTTWAWSEQIAGALVEAHRLGLAHGRLTPSSAVVLKSGELVVDLLGLDFGLVPAEGAAREAARFDRSALAPERTGSPYTEMSISSQSSGASALPRGAGSSAGSGSPGGAVSLRELKRRAAALAISEDDQEGSGRAEATVRAETLVADQAADVFSLAAWWFAFWFREPLSVSVWHRLTTGRPVDALPEFPTDLAANGPPAEPFAELLADMLAVEPVERPTAREAMLRFEALRGNGRKTPGPTKQTQSAALGATFDTIGLGSTRDAQWPAGDDEVSSVAATVSPADPRAIAEANTRFDLSGLPAASPARPNESISALSLAAADREQVTTRRRLTPGEMLGRFEIIAKLGEGGMGAVYKARDPLADREVAIKLLAPHLARSEGARRRFTKEARVLATVNNPYIANLYEFNQDGDAHYLVLEYVPGRSVEKLLDERGALAEETAVSIAADVARALVDAHRRGIVHRDVKPENILIVEETARENTFAAEIVRPSLAPSLQAKLTDFGIAGVSDPSESMAITQAGAMLGTPLYMAPEQWQKSSAVDASS